MSSASKSSLDNDWELATARSRSSTHPTVTSDDELDTMSLPADADDPSDLGDDAWEGIDEDSELESPFESSQEQQPAKPELTPLQSSRPLSADADNDHDAERVPSDLSNSASATDSTFSFHFPDPLEASKEYATYPVNAEPTVESDGETNSVAGTDAVMGMSIGALERSRSATLVLPRNSNSVSPRVATSIYSSSRFALSFAAGIALTALAIACVTLQGSYHHDESMFSRNYRILTPSIRDPLLSKMLPAESPIPVLNIASTVDPLPLIEVPVVIPTPSFEKSLGLEQPSPPPRSIDAIPSSTASPPRDTSLSMNPVKLVASSLSTTYTSFSRLVLRDLHDVLQAIDELLLYLRNHTIADAVEHSKRSIVEYIAQKLADRHERAKTNARKLTNRGMELVRRARNTVA